MDCEDIQIRERLPEYASGNLSSEEMETMRVHLARCSSCRDELDIIAFIYQDHVPEPATGFWTALPGRVISGGARKPRWAFPSPIPAWVWGSAAAVALAALIIGAWPSAQPRLENGTLAEYYFRGGGSPLLGIGEETLPVSGLEVADVGLSLDREIGLQEELDGINPLGGPFPEDLFVGMDGRTIRIFEELIENMTPEGAERG